MSRGQKIYRDTKDPALAARDKFHTLRARATRKLARKSFHFLERYFDLHLTSNDFYSPIPSVKDLPSDVYDRRLSTTGVDMDADGQLELLNSVFAKYVGEYRPEPNGGLSMADAFVLYALIRERKPRKIIEIGGGDSTFISMKALERNRAEGHPCQFICVEPYPRDFLLSAEWPDYQLVTKVVQEVPAETFADADIVFIDSSHVSKIGSDVNYEMFEIVPRTKIGCMIHWHDIVIPTNYWKDWTELGGQFWNESYMLQTFLQFNSSFKVRWAARFMNLDYHAKLKERFPYLTDKHRLTSFWVERTS